MEMFLMAACISMLGIAVAVMAFGAATRDQTPNAEVSEELEPVSVNDPGRFFGVGLAAPYSPQPRVPIEALLLEIESHVRLEQAAAESFLDAPSSSLLHCRTVSRLVN